MPFINVKTNCAVPAEKAEAVKSLLGEAITAIPGKSENWLMIGIEPEQILYFKGTDAPCAIAEVSIFGHADSTAYSKLTELICNIINNELSVDTSRIYVKYSECGIWGWNGSNF